MDKTLEEIQQRLIDKTLDELAHEIVAIKDTMEVLANNDKTTARPALEHLQLTQTWDKVFPQSNKIDYKRQYTR